MADESQTKSPTPEDGTVVKAHNPDDATVVKPAASDDDATVMAGHGSSLKSDPPTDGDDATRVNRFVPGDGSPSAQGPAPEESGANPGGMQDRTMVRPPAGPGDTAAVDALARDTGAVTDPAAPAGDLGDTFTLGSARATVAASPSGGRHSATKGVALGIVTGLVAFAVTAWWLLRHH